jgi:hypothetical protein
MTSTRLWISGLLAMVGGFLMVWSGYASSSLLYKLVGQEGLPFLSGFAAGVASLAISVLELINTLGGITVIIGGIILASGHARTGRIVILLGGGAGLIGLLVSFGYSAYRVGLDQTISYAPYWVGLIFATAARMLARGARSQIKQTAQPTG